MCVCVYVCACGCSERACVHHVGSLYVRAATLRQQPARLPSAPCRTMQVLGRLTQGSCWHQRAIAAHTHSGHAVLCAVPSRTSYAISMRPVLAVMRSRSFCFIFLASSFSMYALRISVIPDGVMHMFEIEHMPHLHALAWQAGARRQHQGLAEGAMRDTCRAIYRSTLTL